MLNAFNEKDRMSIPHDLDECSIADSTARKLWRIAEKVETWGCLILIAIIILGLVCSIITNNFINDITRENSFVAFLSSAAIWSIVAVAEYAAYHLISLLIRALASIVQNTKVSAKVALYNASVNKVHVTTPDRITKHIPPAPKHTAVVERVAAEEYSKDIANEAVQPQYTDADEIICPKCGTKQRVDRTVCWNCNQKFIK